ncbi:MAG: hypothetical protein M3332_18010 [Actinomycetota bacterium]|nr:hypothetical protein [Actinomycetota bacterium]
MSERHETRASEGEQLIIIHAGDGSTSCSLVLSDSAASDFVRDLVQYGFTANDPGKRSRSPWIDPTIAIAENPAAWGALAGIVASYLGRNHSKKYHLKLNKREIQIEGCSPRQAETIIKHAIANANSPDKSTDQSPEA